MKKIFNYLWRLWLIILAFILTTLLGPPVYLLSYKKSHAKIAYQLIRIWCFGMFYGMGMRYELVNLTHKKIDKDRQYIIISNHTSIMDIMLPNILFPHHPLCYVGKKELEKIPIFGTIFRRICVMVDRSSPRSRADVYRRCSEKMDEGNSIVIFPEGGVPDDTSIILDEFKDGAFILAGKHNHPIAVFTFIGLKEMFPFDHGRGYPGKVKIYFNDILEPNEGPKALKLKAHQIIKDTIMEKTL